MGAGGEDSHKLQIVEEANLCKQQGSLQTVSTISIIHCRLNTGSTWHQILPRTYLLDKEGLKSCISTIFLYSKLIVHLAREKTVRCELNRKWYFA